MIETTADNLPRLMNCNGSRLMSPAFPAVSVDPNDRNEGIAAHWMAQQVFNGADINALVGQKMPTGVILTSDMADFVVTYLSGLSAGGQMEVITSHATLAWVINGRADHIHYQPRPFEVDPGMYTEEPLSVLNVDDFKYGWSLVDPYMNWSLIWHAIGYCLKHGIQPDVINLTIHQPRPHHPDGKKRTWTITFAELQDLSQQINQTLANPSDELVTGLSWCRRCHALASCPAATKARMNAIDATAIAFNADMPNDALSYELDLMRTANATIENQLHALEEMASYRLREGAIIDNYALENQYANTRFKPGIDPRALSAASRIDCIKYGTITPAEFKRRGGSQALYDALTERPLTGYKLIRSTADQRARRLLKK